MADIHPTAVVDRDAELAGSVSIGPYAVIGSGVQLAEGVSVGAHAVVEGQTRIGEGTQLAPHAVVGLAPQHRRDRGDGGRTVIGARCVLREHVTVHRGTDGGRGVTEIADDCYLMVGVHVAHDCVIGAGVTMANNATLGGHVTVGEGAYLGGLAAIHQNVHVGKFAMVPAFVCLRGHVVPYALVLPNGTWMGGMVRGANLVGLRRRGIQRETIRKIADSVRILCSEGGSLSRRLSGVEQLYGDEPAVRDIISFVEARDRRGFLGGEQGDAVD